MTTIAEKPLRVFCSYSRSDEKHLNDLRDSLRGLERQGLIKWWHDRKIVPGWEWEEDIDKHLRTADVILLLVSRTFMASDYVYEKEIGVAVERHERGEARVIPVIVRPADWEWASFGKLQALPKDAKPITRWPDPDDAWLDVVKGVRRAVGELLRERHEQAAREQYRKVLEEAWTDDKLSEEETEQLGGLANELGLDTETAADIERNVMGDRKESILERQERVARKDERKKRLSHLYARASRLHQDEEWQAVVDVFAQINSEAPAYQDHEGLLASAHEALETARKQEEALSQYHEAVESAWQGGELHGREVERLRDLANELELNPDKTAEIEREVMSDTLQTILEHQETLRKRYREAVEAVWADNRVRNAEAERLGVLASELGLSGYATADIEREVMGDTMEAILGRQEQASREKITASNVNRIQLLRTLRWMTATGLGATAVAFSPDGQLLAAVGDLHPTVRLWRTEDGTLLSTLQDPDGYFALDVAFSPDGQLLATCADEGEGVLLWRVEDRILLRSLPHREMSISDVEFSPDGRLLASAGHGENTVRLWRVEDGALLHMWEGPESSVASVAFSPDGRLLASGSNQKVRLWGVEDGALLNTLMSRKRTVNIYGLTFSPDGRLLAAAGWVDGTVRLWRVEDGTLLRTLNTGHTSWVENVAFSPDGQLLATCANDGEGVRLWRVEDGVLVATLREHEELVECVAFSPDGRHLVSGSDVVRLWGVV